MFMASECSTVSVAVFVAVALHWAPILCSLQTCLRPLPVQTQGTQLLKVFIQLYYNNSHQQYENEVSHSSMFKISIVVNHTMYKISILSQIDTLYRQKDSWGSFTATGSESTEREQTPCSTHLNRVYFYK